MSEFGHRAGLARLAHRPQRIVDALHVGQKFLDRRPLVGKPLGQRVIGRVETGGQREALADGTAAHMMQRAGRQPFDLVENAEIPEDRVLHVARIARVGGLVQRGFDREPADPINRSRPAQTKIALQQADAVAGLGQQGPRRKPAKPGTDHHGVEFLDLSHVSSRFPAGLSIGGLAGVGAGGKCGGNGLFGGPRSAKRTSALQISCLANGRVSGLKKKCLNFRTADVRYR